MLYLSGDRERYLEESGTMNLFLVTSDGELITPGLGTILEGVTRDSVLELADEHDLKPVRTPGRAWTTCVPAATTAASPRCSPPAPPR